MCGKPTLRKMIHKFRTLESDLDRHSYNQNLEKLTGSFLKKQTDLQISFKKCVSSPIIWNVPAKLDIKKTIQSLQKGTDFEPGNSCLDE